jgi:hypothetical protein
MPAKSGGRDLVEVRVARRHGREADLALLAPDQVAHLLHRALALDVLHQLADRVLALAGLREVHDVEQVRVAEQAALVVVDRAAADDDGDLGQPLLHALGEAQPFEELEAEGHGDADGVGLLGHDAVHQLGVGLVHRVPQRRLQGGQVLGDEVRGLDVVHRAGGVEEADHGGQVVEGLVELAPVVEARRVAHELLAVLGAQQHFLRDGGDGREEAVAVVLGATQLGARVEVREPLGHEARVVREPVAADEVVEDLHVHVAHRGLVAARAQATLQHREAAERNRRQRAVRRIDEEDLHGGGATISGGRRVPDRADKGAKMDRLV